MSKWNMVIDVALCHDCNNCFLSCKDEYVGNNFLGYSVEQSWSGQRWMNIERKERGQYPMVQVAYLPMPCMHCDEAPCVTSDGAVYKREDGLVIIDPEKARGRKEIASECPYGAIYWNEEANVAQKCTGCAHLLDSGWTETRCTLACPTGALKVVLADDATMIEKAEAEGLKSYMPQRGTKPRVWYKNLQKWTKSFVGGTVVYGDTDECAEHALVTLTVDGREVVETRTNNYGDFTIDGLEPGHYDLIVEATGYDAEVLAVDISESKTLGLILLRRPTGGL